ncbi:LRR receptor-like serine/threonine-protein kinase FLS2 [Hordeum vulgare]|nr:LRR receptor-like serine/threonine-protein kinase FLS2 [Hordeum vulgare]
MEAVDGMMRGLKLSEEERCGVKIRVPVKEKGKTGGVGGIDCNKVGENLFVFTFNQESGKRRALEDGPWMFEKDQVVVEDYDPEKRPEDYAFNEIPIWVRIFSLPLGMMNADSAEEIGNIVGSFVEADVGVDGKAMGRFMGVKIRMNIDKPIMRGVMMDDAALGSRQKQKKKMSIDGGREEEEGAWCRFEYELLPDFCYDKIFEKVINPYLTEVLKHPQSIKMSERMLHIHDVEGPKKIGSVETRLEAMEEQVFKCQGMVERGLNANHMMITNFTSNHKMDAIDIGKHLSRLYDRVDQLQG